MPEDLNRQPPLPAPSSTAPLHPGNLLQYDDAGHPYIQDMTGRFVPYFTQFPHFPPGTPVQPPHGPFVSYTNPRNGQNPQVEGVHMDAPAPPLSQTTSSSNAVASSSRPPPIIDPSLNGLPPLPDSDDDDLSDGPTIAKARGYSTAKKVAGSRQKSTGKQHAISLAIKGKQRVAAPEASRKRKAAHSGDESHNGPETKRGRPRGAGNYHADDVTELLDAVEAELPLGQRGWIAIHKQYLRWARKNKRPERTVKSLETKYKQLIKTTMPTGDGYCPPDVKRAHGIEELINERACTRDLDDSDFDGNTGIANTQNSEGEDDDNDDEVEVIEQPSLKKAVRDAVVRRPDPLATTTRRKNRGNGMELVAKLTDAFDPATVRARDAERADRSLHTTQYLTLSQQLRDAQMTIETLRAQLTTFQSRVHDAERARDRADLKLEMFELSRGRQSSPSWSRKAGRGRRSKSTKRALEHFRGKTRVVERYPEGGESSWWVTDPSSTSSDEKKEMTSGPSTSTSRKHHYHKYSRFTRGSRENYHSSSRHHEPFSIRPPSPFGSAMSDLNDRLPDPPHFGATAGDCDFEGTQVSEKDFLAVEKEDDNLE